MYSVLKCVLVRLCVKGRMYEYVAASIAAGFGSGGKLVVQLEDQCFDPWPLYVKVILNKIQNLYYS